MQALRESMKESLNPEWWYTPVIPALGRWRPEDREFKASPGCRENAKLAWAARELVETAREAKEEPTDSLSKLHSGGRAA